MKGLEMSEAEMIEWAAIESEQAANEGVQVEWDDEIIEYPHEEENYHDFEPEYRYFAD